MIVMYDVLRDGDRWCLERSPERTYFQWLIFQMEKTKQNKTAYSPPHFPSAGQVSIQGR